MWTESLDDYRRIVGKSSDGYRRTVTETSLIKLSRLWLSTESWKSRMNFWEVATQLSRTVSEISRNRCGILEKLLENDSKIAKKICWTCVCKCVLEQYSLVSTVYCSKLYLVSNKYYIQTYRARNPEFSRLTVPPITIIFQTSRDDSFRCDLFHRSKKKKKKKRKRKN